MSGQALTRLRPFPACPTELSSHSLFLAASTAMGILIFPCERFPNPCIHCCPQRSAAFESPGFYLQRKSRRTPGSHGGGEKAPQKDKGSKTSSTSHRGLNLKAMSPNLNGYSNIYAPSWGIMLCLCKTMEQKAKNSHFPATDYICRQWRRWKAGCSSPDDELLKARTVSFFSSPRQPPAAGPQPPGTQRAATLSSLYVPNSLKYMTQYQEFLKRGQTQFFHINVSEEIIPKSLNT